MILHISAQNWASVGVETFTWNVFNVYDSIVRWAVPVFVMISGALFLDGNQSIAQIYRKNILRIITAFIFWSAIYAFVFLSAGQGTLINAAVQIIQGHYHMWFLFMIVGLYIIIPFLRKIAADVDLMRYFLILSLVFTFLLPQIITLVSFKAEKISAVANRDLNNVNFHFTLGYVGYFVCGYYLNKIDIKGKKERVVYLLGICGFIMTIVLSAMLSIKQKSANGTFYGNFTINVMLESIAVFVFAKNNWNLSKVSPKVKEMLRMFSKYSFGAYLAHALIIEQLNNLLGINTLSFHPVLSVPAIGIIVFIISFAISGILNHIPVLNKYIV